MGCVGFAGGYHSLDRKTGEESAGGNGSWVWEGGILWARWKLAFDVRSRSEVREKKQELPKRMELRVGGLSSGLTKAGPPWLAGCVSVHMAPQHPHTTRFSPGRGLRSHRLSGPELGSEQRHLQPSAARGQPEPPPGLCGVPAGSWGLVRTQNLSSYFILPSGLYSGGWGMAPSA